MIAGLNIGCNPGGWSPGLGWRASHLSIVLVLLVIRVVSVGGRGRWRFESGERLPGRVDGQGRKRGCGCASRNSFRCKVLERCGPGGRLDRRISEGCLDIIQDGLDKSNWYRRDSSNWLGRDRTRVLREHNQGLGRGRSSVDGWLGNGRGIASRLGSGRSFRGHGPLYQHLVAFPCFLVLIHQGPVTIHQPQAGPVTLR